MDISREEIEQADVIIGLNKANGVETVFYGLSLLTLISGGYEGPGGLRPTILRVPLDFNSDEPEWLAAACMTLKRSKDGPTDNES
ncbi:MAG TPA: hypothetical protein VLM91_02090 [Candidatus Methylomirabilis sp.]|nr:hypothetical protein [Candidatus Methylomirabilis sp.]